MANITIGTKLQSVKNGLIATVADINAKYRTAFVELSNDTNASYSLSTLKDKRQWVVITNEEAEEITQKDESEASVTAHELVQMPGTEDPDWGEKHYNNNIDEVLLTKFVKKAQRIITALSKDETGYHVTVENFGKIYKFDDKNLQNIRSAIGHIYRGEVTI